MTCPFVGWLVGLSHKKAGCTLPGSYPSTCRFNNKHLLSGCYRTDRCPGGARPPWTDWTPRRAWETGIPWRPWRNSKRHFQSLCLFCFFGYFLILKACFLFTIFSLENLHLHVYISIFSHIY